MSTWQYYYRRMPQLQQEIYHRLLVGLKELAPSIHIPKCDGEVLSTLFFQLRLDHPEIFWAVGYSCRSYVGAESWEFIPDYMFRKDKVKEHQKALAARLERLARPAKDLDEAGKVRYIHDFILENVRYDKLEKPYSHEIIGPMTNGVGVCEGIAKSVKLLCDELDVPCMIPISDRDRLNGEKYLHAWNIVQLGGKYYHLDATFDNTLAKKCGFNRYDYYLLNDEKIFRDHRALLYPAPECSDGKRFGYLEQKRSFTKPEDVQKRIDQAIKKKKPDYIFHWRGGYLTRETLMEICSLIEQTARARDAGVEIRVNWPQAVIFTKFTQNAPMSVQNDDAGEDVQ